MTETYVQDRNRTLREYLQFLRLLADELDRTMQAIALNSLTVLEDSVANQHVFSARLGELANELGQRLKVRPASFPVLVDQDLMGEIRAASDKLQNLNRRYSHLLKLSSHSVALMVSLFSSFQGRIQEGSGAKVNQHTWSCQM